MSQHAMPLMRKLMGRLPQSPLPLCPVDPVLMSILFLRVDPACEHIRNGCMRSRGWCTISRSQVDLQNPPDCWETTLARQMAQCSTQGFCIEASGLAPLPF